MFCVVNENNTNNREENFILLRNFGYEPNLYTGLFLNPFLTNPEIYAVRYVLQNHQLAIKKKTNCEIYRISI